MPSTTPTSPQICRDFTYRRCKRGVGCPYKHDPTRRKIATDKRWATSRTKIQQGYSNDTNGNTTQPKIVSTLCTAYLENRCKKVHCKFIHNGYLALDYVDRAKELLEDVLNTLRQSGDQKIAEDDVGHCYYYNTGAHCVRHIVSAICPFTHTLAIRRAVIKVLGGKTLSQTILTETEQAVDHVSCAGPAIPEVKIQQIAQGISDITLTPKDVPFLVTTVSVRSPSHYTDDSQDSTKTYASEKAHTMVRVEGEWDKKSHWYEWGLRNIQKYQCAKNFGLLISGLEDGKNPRTLMTKMRKTAPVGCIFKYFSILPSELRIRIWRLRLKADRHEVRIKFTYDWEIGRPTNVAIRKLSLVPPMLHVNWEARLIAQKNFNLLGATKWGPATVYFNSRRDRLFVQTSRPNELSYVLQYMSGYDASRIMHLIIPMRDFVKGDELLVSHCLPYFCNTRKLTLYYGKGKLDMNTLHSAVFKRHVKGINACIVSSWSKFLRGLPYPMVDFVAIHEILAHYYGIDLLVY